MKSAMFSMKGELRTYVHHLEVLEAFISPKVSTFRNEKSPKVSEINNIFDIFNSFVVSFEPNSIGKYVPKSALKSVIVERCPTL